MLNTSVLWLSEAARLLRLPVEAVEAVATVAAAAAASGAVLSEGSTGKELNRMLLESVRVRVGLKVCRCSMLVQNRV
jgi:hypothetical protein